MNKDFLDQFHQLHKLQAVCAGLTPSNDLAQIKAISTDIARIRHQLKQHEAASKPEMGGLYHGMETLCAVYAIGKWKFEEFIPHAMDFLAAELDTAALAPIYNLNTLGHVFGEEVIDQIFELIKSATDFCHEYRRFETTVESDLPVDAPRTIYGRIDGKEADEFDEAPICPCGPDQEGATLITIISIDIDLWEGLIDLIEQRDEAGRRAMRQPIKAA